MTSPNVVFVECDTEETWTWIDRRGNETVLPVLAASEGRFMPPTITDAVRVFGEAGERRLRQEFDAREIVLPLGLKVQDCPERQALRVALRQLGCNLDTTAEVGTLRCELEGTPARQIRASYQSGFEIVEEFTRLATPVLVLRAHETFWEDTEDTLVEFPGGSGFPFFLPDQEEPAGLFGSPMPPFVLSSPSVASQETVEIGCDANVFPVWTITGPGQGFLIRNLTTGAQIILENLNLDFGETLTIDTRPGFKTVRDGQGNNRFGELDPASTLFPLEPGENDLAISVSQFFEGVVPVTLTFRERFLTV